MEEEKYQLLNEKFLKLMSGYGSAINEKFSSEHHFYSLVVSQIPHLLEECAEVKNPYLIKGSCGIGNWANVPWICVFDERITKSAQKGVYIAILLNKDAKELFLTFNQAARKLKVKELKQKSANLRGMLDRNIFLDDDNIDTGDRKYDAGCIFYKKYNVSDFPSGKGITQDLLEMLNIYGEYYQKISGNNTDEDPNSWLLTWNPLNYAFSEYEEKRQTIINGKQYIDSWACSNKNAKVGDRVYLMKIGAGDKNGIIASGYVEKESYQAPHYDSTKAAEGEQINKIDVKFDCMIDKNESNYLTQSKLNELFPNQHWSPQSSGIQIKKEYQDALEQEWQKYVNNEEVEEETMSITTKDAIAHIKTYIAAKGFSYNDGLIENFYLSLKSKPFVILAGTSGTGKTRLVRLFAEAMGAEYKLVPVRPDWSDSSDLFGHVDLNGNYMPGPVLDFIAEANKNPVKPYILCLDEMNLARVEYYFSDFLSVIETRDFAGDTIISDPLITLEKYGSDDNAREKYGEIGFPQNLYVVGTVNMDETTFPFSKKVLDRANTIEFNYVDLMPQENEAEEVGVLNLPNSFLKTQYLLLVQCTEEKEYIKDISSKLQTMNEVLQKANAHIGYRVRDEIVFYMLNNKETELLSDDEAFDNEIMQKILPRIQGSSSLIKEMLCDLFKIFAEDYDGIQTQSDDTASKMLKKIDKDGALYPKSAEKIAFMIRRFEEDGFTSYWL